MVPSYSPFALPAASTADLDLLTSEATKGRTLQEIEREGWINILRSASEEMLLEIHNTLSMKLCHLFE